MSRTRGPLRIAAHESRSYFRLVQPRILLLAALVGALIAFSGPAVRERGLHPDADLYRVEVDERSALFPAVASDEAFQVIDGIGAAFHSGRADLLIIGETLYYHEGDDRSAAAARHLELATRRWLDDSLSLESDRAAAFPVRVNIVYEPRSIVAGAPPPPSPENPEPAPAPTDGAAPESQLIAREGEKQLSLRPNDVQPPFPIRGLLLTFAYVVPLNFVGQLYAGSLLAERTRQRGVLLLSTPHSGAQILLGKSLPYIVAALAIGIIVTVLIDAGLVGFLAALPILTFGLATTLVLALIARSLRELTFLLVATTVLFSTFLFLPAIFTQIHPVAFLSPVSVIIAALRGQEVAIGSFLYATVPLFAASLVLGAIGVALYREETLFAPRNPIAKLADGIHQLARSRTALVVVGALAVPFAIGLELFVLIFAVTLNLQVAFIVFLLGGALVEEALKGIIVHARLTRGPTKARPWLVGSLVGGGFFLGEKIALVFSLVGFDLLPLGPDALATFGIAQQAVLVLAPLALHGVAATVTAYGARAGRTLIGWATASLLHASYNGFLVFLFLQGVTL